MSNGEGASLGITGQGRFSLTSSEHLSLSLSLPCFCGSFLLRWESHSLGQGFLFRQMSKQSLRVLFRLTPRLSLSLVTAATFSSHAALEVRRRGRASRDPGLLCVLGPVCGIGGFQGILAGMGTVGTMALRVLPYVSRLVGGWVYSG